MKRARASVPGLFGVAAVVCAGACGHGEVDPGDGSPTPTPSPTATGTPTPAATATPADPHRVALVSTSGNLLHEGHAVLFRLTPASGPSLCGFARIDDGDPWGFTITSAGLASDGATYGVEVVLGADGNTSYTAGVDHPLTHAPITVTSDLTLTLTHGDLAAGGWVDGGSETATPPSFSWTDGTSCPGDPP